MGSLAQKLLDWFDEHGRHDLPWQERKTPYRTWVSEVMLQQTQVKTVIPYYQKFMARFPTVQDLAAAEQEEVLTYWAGLGYYARGRNLHKAAQVICDQYQGAFPTSFDDIVALPGIGRSTAGAILSISLQQRYPILDGNVKRVLGRLDAIEQWPGERETEKQMWLRADELTPTVRFADYTQAIMDLGATLCTRSKPNCGKCPWQNQCQAYQQNKVADFPKSKPKKEKPIRAAWMVIAHTQDNEVYLEQRPQTGIWGGLWSLPEFASEQEAQRWIDSHFETATTLLKWEGFKHTFSHYHLQINPLYVGIERRQAQMLQEPSANYDSVAVPAEKIWQNVKTAEETVGLPAPIQRLLAKVSDY